jgi:hypothetical protein
MDEVTEKLMEKLPDIVNQNYNMYSRNINTPQVKKLEKTQKQLNNLRQDFNKHQR